MKKYNIDDLYWVSFAIHAFKIGDVLDIVCKSPLIDVYADDIYLDKLVKQESLTYYGFSIDNIIRMKLSSNDVKRIIKLKNI